MPAVKNVGEPCAGEPHARFEVAAGGNQASRASTSRAAQAPLADPTNRVGLAGEPRTGREMRSPLLARAGRAGDEAGLEIVIAWRSPTARMLCDQTSHEMDAVATA